MALSDEDVREILRLIDETPLAELRVETEGFVLHVRREGATPTAAPVEPAPPSDAPPRTDGLITVPSPMLGTFYRAEGPGQRPFVEVGAQVEPDTTVCIIEVMKMMNSVPAGLSWDDRRGVPAERRARRVRRAAVPGAAGVSIGRVFIPNRGEIALRIVRACRALGIESVVGASDVDLAGLAARSADRVVCIGPGPAAESYLRDDIVVQAALGTGCDAIHPGYGFLSESPRLAVRAREHGLVFVGPPPEVIELAGDKLRAREQAARAGVPVLPGGEIRSAAQADGLGYPLLIKAAGGGGARGIKLAHDPDEVRSQLGLARSEAGGLLGRHLGIGDATVARAWRAYRVQPWRRETFKFSTDPELEAKVRDVVGLYLNPPQNAIVLCVDDCRTRPSQDRWPSTTPQRGRWPGRRQSVRANADSASSSNCRRLTSGAYSQLLASWPAMRRT